MFTIRKSGEPNMGTFNEQEAVERAMQDPEFQRLLPGYRVCEKAEPVAKKPIIHGTGSYALRRIIRNGFVPQKMVLAGEKSHHDANDEINPLSFTTPKDGGDKLSHWFGDLAAKDNQLAFDADDYLKTRTIRILEDVMGGLEANVITEAQNETKTIPEDDLGLGKGLILEMTKAEIRKEIEWLIVDRGRRAANVFNPEIAINDIMELERLIKEDSDNPGEVEAILRKQSLLNEIRWYYAPKGERLPKYRTAEMIRWIISDLKNKTGHPYDLITAITNKKIELLRRKIAEYNALPPEERSEIENQFPCYIIIEAEGIEGEITERPEEAGGKLGGKLVELWSHNRIPPERIREIQVPEAKIPEVEKWLNEAGISGVRVVPFEYFEMKEVLEKKPKTE